MHIINENEIKSIYKPYIPDSKGNAQWKKSHEINIDDEIAQKVKSNVNINEYG